MNAKTARFALIILTICQLTELSVNEEENVDWGEFGIGDKSLEDAVFSDELASKLAERKNDVNDEDSRRSLKTYRRHIQKIARSSAVDVDMSNGSLSLSGATAAEGPALEWLRNLQTLHLLTPSEIPEDVSFPCSKNTASYLSALRNNTLWALRMMDSSGRYSSQFYFGNDFFLGSRTMCREINNPYYNPKQPSFSVHFFVAKYELHGSAIFNSGMNGRRSLRFGVCLPRECSATDVQSLLMARLRHSGDGDGLSASIISVRAVPGKYALADDPKLHLLLMILGVVVTLSVFGTAYEASLERKKRRRELRKRSVSGDDVKRMNNNNGDIGLVTVVDGDSPVSADKFSGIHFTARVQNGERNENEMVETKASSVTSQVLLSFSALSNGRKILYCGNIGQDSLTCVHGIRFVSLLWVILVHTYLQVFTVAENKFIRNLAERNFLFQTVSNATFSVDSFFFISGLLVTYLYFKSDNEEKGEKRRAKRLSSWAILMKFFKLIGYRLIRLTPAYMFVLLIAEISMRWLHNISVFEPISQNHISCDKYWWRNILYINSLFPMKDMCMLWSWYVSNDTQFYAIGVILLLISVRYFKLSVGMLFSFLVTSWFVTIAIAIRVDYRAKIEEPFASFDELYDKPWTRLGPYLVGMAAGWYLINNKCRLTFTSKQVLIGWIASLSTLSGLVYGLQSAQPGLIGSALYVSIGHTAWGVALAWIVIACCTGYGGFINSLLSCQLVQPLSRLTYCAYLVHPIVMTVTNFQMGAPLHLQDAIIIIMYLGNIVASFVFSFCISLLFEAPVVRLLKIIFAPAPKRQSRL